MKVPKLQSIMGVAAGEITEAQLNEALAELQAAGGEGFVQLMQSLGKAPEAAPVVDVKASVEYKALEAKLTAEQSAVQSLTAKLEGYEKPGDVETKPVKREEKIAATGSADADAFLSEADIEMRKIWGK